MLELYLKNAVSSLFVCGFLVLTGFGSAAQAEKHSTDPVRETALETHAKAQKFLDAVRGILEQAAKDRKDQRKLPSKRDFTILTPPWTETREDRQKNIRNLLDAALEIVTDVPIVQMQKNMKTRRSSINELKEQIATLREKSVSAPKDAMLPGILTDTVDSLNSEIADLEKRIALNQREIELNKKKIYKALQDAGVNITPSQLNLMLDSVLGGDLLKLVAAFESVKAIDSHLSTLMDRSGEDLKTARKYFALHASLFAMLVHAQGTVIERIDNVYLDRLGKIIDELQSARSETWRLLKGKNRKDQRRTLEANLKSQKFAEKVAAYYGNYLNTQRQKLIEVRKRTLRDLRIADNTFRTVEASFQLRSLIDHARGSFEAIKRLETPGFDRLFKNEKLRREFEKLTDQLVPGS